MVSRLEHLKKRSDFLSTASAGKKWVALRVVIQAAPREKDDQSGPDVVRVGVTASKKVGGAVVRNKAKRRLRAIARDILKQHASPDQTYVLIARPATATCRFADVCGDVVWSLKRMKLWIDGGESGRA